MVEGGIFNIFTDNEQSQIEPFAKLGLEVAAKRILEGEIKRVSDLALRAAETYCPFRTSELYKALRIESSNKLSARIVPNPNLHTSSRTPEPIPNPELAEILDLGTHRRGIRRKFKTGVQFLRRKRGVSVAPFIAPAAFTPTADWFANAQEALARELNNG